MSAGGEPDRIQTPRTHDDASADAGQDAGYRLYRELAPWWPLISPPGEYAEDAGLLTGILAETDRPVYSVLDLGCGGGHVARHLAAGRSLTLVDLSAQMLAVSRRLNPECEHVQADMRTLRLDREFDAVLVHDAVDYLTTTTDLRKVIETAFAHCAPGGLAIFAPDHTAETFRPGTGAGGGSEPRGRQASFTERTSDPDPADDWILAEYEFTLRDADGSVTVVPEAHRLGSFRRRTWLALLAAAGFEATTRPGAGSGASSRVLFVGRRSGGRG